MQQQHPEWKVGQVAQELGRYWKALSDDERAIYERKALDDKERYAEVCIHIKRYSKVLGLYDAITIKVHSVRLQAESFPAPVCGYHLRKIIVKSSEEDAERVAEGHAFIIFSVYSHVLAQADAFIYLP